MRGGRWPVFLPMALLLAASPAAADDWSLCAGDAPDPSIAGCTAVLKRGVESESQRVQAHFNRGLAYEDKLEHAAAIADYDEVIRLNATYVSAYVSRAIANFRLGEYDRAIVDLDKAIRLKPTHANAWKTRAATYDEKHQYDRAIADNDQAIRLNPKDAETFRNRGVVYRHKGVPERAIADLTQAIRLKPAYALAYYSRGLAYEDKSDHAHAIADYTQAIRLDPAIVDAYQSRGIAYANTGARDLATRDYDKAIRLNPTNADIYFDRGLNFENGGELEKSRADYLKALELKPDDEPTKEGLERIGKRLAEREAPKVAAVQPRAEPAQLPPSPAPAVKLVADKRVALVIGNSSYKVAGLLPNPVRDATAVAEELRGAGFAVTVVNDANRSQMIAALRAFRNEADKSDWAVVFYAGHGMETGGKNYLLPTDAHIESDRDIDDEAVALARVESAIEGAHHLRLVILDACRNNPLLARMVRTASVSRSVERGFARVEPRAGTLVVFAAKEGETADDGDGGHSPFTTAFLAQMRRPGLEVRRLFDSVRDDVLEATKNRQMPFSYGSLSSRRDFYFVSASNEKR